MEKAQEMHQIILPRQHTVKINEESNNAVASADALNISQDKIPPARESPQALQLRMSQEPTKAGTTKPNSPDTLSQSDRDIYQLREDCHNLRSELKSAYRENRDQSLQLRDLKKANAVWQEKIAYLREQISQLREAFRARGEKPSKSENAKLIEHIDMLEGHITYLREERQKREAHTEFLTQQTREANEEKSSTYEECRKLQRQVRDLSNNLTECKDDLLRLQPTSQVPDNEISDQYADLDQRISGWVDEQTEDPQTLEEQFERMQTIEDLPDLFQTYLSTGDLRMAKRHPSSQPFMLRYLVHRYLGTFMFDEDIYLFGLDTRNVALLKGLEGGMKLLEPRRDRIALRRWRSESLQGLLKMEDFIEEQERQAKLLSQTLQSAMSCLISESSDTQTTCEDLHKQVTLPAISLATKMRLSMSDYRLTPHIFAKDSGQHVGAFVYEIKDSHMIDITTHKVIRPDSMLKVAEDGRIGDEALVISPALLRVLTSGKGRVLVCKPTILVKLNEPMGKRSRGIKALGAWTPGWFRSDEAAD